MAYKLSEDDFHRFENELTFSIPREFCELYDQIPGSTMSSIIESKPDGIVRVFDINRSYASWKKKVVVSDFLQGFDHRKQMGRVRDQGNHSGCWTIVSSELVSALRFIRGDDTVYTEYSSQFLMDYACPAKASLKNQKNGHYCYKYSPLKAMDFMITDGLPREEHWPYQGCRKASPPVYTPPPPEYPHVYIASRKSLRTLEEAMEKLASHPIGAGLAIFTPDYQMIKGGIYRGPMYRESKFEELHAVSLYRVGMEEGEAIGYVKSTHGELIGEKGCLKVSLEVLMVEVPQEGREADDEFKKPKRLLSRFFYPELPPREVGV